jgi:3-deoxy-D-manno-octulosonate 8-phosphate phosphatase (KDO 8-P phosphatase)
MNTSDERPFGKLRVVPSEVEGRLATSDVSERAKRVKLLVLDIDGVLTDGRIIYGIYGEELKFFDVQDGLGIVLLKRGGIPSVIITAKKSRIVRMRSKDLKIDKTYQGYPTKLIPFNKALKKFRVSPEEVCFIGDDVIDIPVLSRVGFAVAVPNAVDEVKEVAHYITAKLGGRGAVREACDLILKSQGRWELATSKYVK